MRKSAGILIMATLCAVLSSTGVMAQESTSDSLAHTLQEVVVKARADFFKIKGPDKFSYEVWKDSTLRDAMTIDALKKVPILNAANDGEVSSMNGNPLVFKINGLRDPLLSNLSQALTAIPANTLKSIDFSEEIDGGGKRVFEVNIITKGRLEGYRVQLTSNVTDSKWKNGVWALSKLKRLTFNGSYFNTWEWGHHMTIGNEECRDLTPDFYKYESFGEKSGYKVDLHNFEAGLSYDVDDNSFLSLYGNAMFKTNPRYSSHSAHAIYAADGSSALSYNNLSEAKMNDAEYSVSVKFERVYKNRPRPGHLNLGYQFYTRPFGSKLTNIYEKIDCNTDADIGFLNLNNSVLKTDQTYTTHTLVGEWKKKPNRNMLLELYGRLRVRHESYENRMEYSLARLSPSLSHSKTELDEYFGILTPKFLYFTNWWEVCFGTVLEAYRHKVNSTGMQSPVTNSKAYVLPFLSGTILTPKKMTISLAYNIGNNIPDVTALDPYIDRSIPGEVRYGNPNLKSQLNHTVKLEIGGKTGKLYTEGIISASYVDDIILAYSFADKGEVNYTFGNIASKKGVGFAGYTSGRLHRNTYLRFNVSVDWIQYKSSLLSINNSGWSSFLKLRLEQELPWNLTLDASASYNSRPVMLQGEGAADFTYELGFYRQFFKRKLSVLVSAASFIPVWYKQSSSVEASGYNAQSWCRSFHASFALSLRYTFGKLKTQVKENCFDFENDEIKRNYTR